MQAQQQYVDLNFGLWNLKNTNDANASVLTTNFLVLKHLAVFLETKANYQSLPNINGSNFVRIVLGPTAESRSHEDIVVYYDKTRLAVSGILKVWNFSFRNNRNNLKQSGDVHNISFKYKNGAGNEGVLNVYLAHLTAKKGHETAKQRLIEILGRIKPDPNERTVFLADFNLKKSAPVELVDIGVATGTVQYRTLLDQATSSSFWKTAIPTNENTTIWACDPWKGHLDNILFDSRCIAYVAHVVDLQKKRQIISDHQAITARLRLKD